MGILIRSASSGGGSSATQPWDATTPLGYVQPGKSTNGAGTEVDPYQLSQVYSVSLNASGYNVFIFLPGDVEVTTQNSTDIKYAALNARGGPSASRLVIFKAQFPGSTNPVLRTRIRRTASSGVIFGFDNVDNAVWDGFVCDTKSGADETDDPLPEGSWGEIGQASAWFSDNVYFVRCYFDHLGATYDGGNRNSIFGQGCLELTIKNNYFTGSGDRTVGGTSNVTSVMTYDCATVRIQYNTFHNNAHAIWIKGEHGVGFQEVYDVDISHNRITDCFLGITITAPIETITSGRTSSVYLNYITGCQWGIELYATGVVGGPSGLIVANNTIGAPTVWNASVDFWGTVGFIIHNGNGDGFAANQVKMQNNAVQGCTSAIALYPNSTDSDYDRILWDFNGYHGYTTFCFGPESSNISVASWQADTPARDTDGLFAANDPLYVNTATPNHALQAGSPYRNAGEDVLQLLGGLATAQIHIGCFITSDMSDQFGWLVA